MFLLKDPFKGFFFINWDFSYFKFGQNLSSWVLSQFEFLSCVIIQIFEFCHIFSFVTFWVFEFFLVTFWVLSQFEFLSFVIIWVFEFHHILSFWILSQFKFHHNLSLWHKFSFWFLSQFQLLNMSYFEFSSFVTIWVFEFGHHFSLSFITTWVFSFYFITIGFFEFNHNLSF